MGKLNDDVTLRDAERNGARYLEMLEAWRTQEAEADAELTRLKGVIKTDAATDKFDISNMNNFIKFTTRKNQIAAKRADLKPTLVALNTKLKVAQHKTEIQAEIDLLP